MIIRQCIYQSRATRPMNDVDLCALLNEARDLNGLHNITGLLLFIEHHFMQCIEGSSDEIAQLVENIRKDERNEAMLILSDHEVEQRAFPNWTMGFHMSPETNLQTEDSFQNILSSKDLNKIAHTDQRVFRLMREFYVNNAGKSFG